MNVCFIQLGVSVSAVTQISNIRNCNYDLRSLSSKRHWREDGWVFAGRFILSSLVNLENPFGKLVNFCCMNIFLLSITCVRLTKLDDNPNEVRWIYIWYLVYCMHTKYRGRFYIRKTSDGNILQNWNRQDMMLIFKYSLEKLIHRFPKCAILIAIISTYILIASQVSVNNLSYTTSESVTADPLARSSIHHNIRQICYSWNDRVQHTLE